VSGIGVSSQIVHIGDNPRPDRVEVNIANQFSKVSVLLADNGLVPVLKKGTVALVPELKLIAYPVRSLLISRANGTVPVRKREWA